MGNKQGSIYWNPIKRGGNKMNKRRERKREIPSISKPFLPFCTCPTSRWVREQRVPSSPTSVSYHFPLLFFFSLSFSRSITSSFFLLLLHCILPRECLPGLNPIFHRFEPICMMWSKSDFITGNFRCNDRV